MYAKKPGGFLTEPGCRTRKRAIRRIRLGPGTAPLSRETLLHLPRLSCMPKLWEQHRVAGDEVMQPCFSSSKNIENSEHHRASSWSQPRSCFW